MPGGKEPHIRTQKNDHCAGNKEQYENHILSADHTKPLETLFCWHGFQYVRVSSEGRTGFKGGLHDIVGLEIHTNMSQTGKLQFDGSHAGRVRKLRAPLFAARTLDATGQGPGHAIAAVRELKSGLWITAGGKGG